MKTVKLASGLYLLMFDPAPGGFEGLNILALVEGRDAFFLDTGYAPSMEAAQGFLRGLGARAVGAAISHYHADHAGGLRLLGGIETWGSDEFAASLSPGWPAGERAALAPAHRVRGRELVAFAGHEIELFSLPGHTLDSLGAIVDGEILYAADTLLLTNGGAPILPSVHARPISLHADSLRALRPYLNLVFVPGHGAPLTDRAARARDLDNRLAYIEAIAAKPGLSLEEAQADCDPKFLGSAWHEENWR